MIFAGAPIVRASTVVSRSIFVAEIILQDNIHNVGRWSTIYPVLYSYASDIKALTMMYDCPRRVAMVYSLCVS